MGHSLELPMPRASGATVGGQWRFLYCKKFLKERLSVNSLGVSIATGRPMRRVGVRNTNDDGRAHDLNSWFLTLGKSQFLSSSSSRWENGDMGDSMKSGFKVYDCVPDFLITHKFIFMSLRLLLWSSSLQMYPLFLQS
ncbi:hypothetical protein K1719_023297 [Acacia pycnantha]|nr:hypothetical protein K1719_023297 [Acacia pycnantha]